jgi:hypothetical protein
VLAFVALAFVAYSLKSMAQVAVINNASIGCAARAKADPGDRSAMERCLKARGVLVEDSPPSDARVVTAASAPPVPASYDECLRSRPVRKYEAKSDMWASAMQACINAYGGTAVITMDRNPRTGEIEYGINH